MKLTEYESMRGTILLIRKNVLDECIELLEEKHMKTAADEIRKANDMPIERPCGLQAQERRSA